MVKFSFSVLTITEAKQSNRETGARAVDLPTRFGLARPGIAPPLITGAYSWKWGKQPIPIHFLERPLSTHNSHVQLLLPNSLDFTLIYLLYSF